VVGLDLLRDMAEFFQAFSPLYAGFRERATEVEALLRSPKTLFVLVAGPGEERNPDTLFFARRLRQAGLNLGPIVVNRVHPEPDEPERSSLRSPAPSPRPQAPGDGLARLLADDQPLVDLPLRPEEPTDLPSLADLGADLEERLADWQRHLRREA
jgi:anion-transporting  ArsA/GET3 family ATPase